MILVIDTQVHKTHTFGTVQRLQKGTENQLPRPNRKASKLLLLHRHTWTNVNGYSLFKVRFKRSPSSHKLSPIAAHEIIHHQTCRRFQISEALFISVAEMLDCAQKYKKNVSSSTPIDGTGIKKGKYETN